MSERSWSFIACLMAYLKGETIVSGHIFRHYPEKEKKSCSEQLRSDCSSVIAPEVIGRKRIV